MATNTGVVFLSRRTLGDTTMNNRLDIEDNIGEGIHIHYKNFRLDYTIEEFIGYSEACKKALEELGVK